MSNNNGVSRRKGKKNRKHGRNKIWCENYRRRGQREKNKLIRLKKHLDNHPNDDNVKNVIKAL